MTFSVSDCKPPSLRQIPLVYGLICLLLFAGVQLDARAKADRVNGRLRHVAEVVGWDTTSFWSDCAWGRVLAVL